MNAWYWIHVPDEEVAEIWIYSVIGRGTGDGVPAAQFAAELERLPETVRAIRLHLNSPGGDALDSGTVCQALRAQAEKRGRAVEVHIEGMAASGASMVSCAGDTVKICRDALMMVHNPMMMVIGNADHLERTSRELRRYRDDVMLPIYERRTRMSRRTLVAMLDAETWLDAEEAVASRFADEIILAPPMRISGFDPTVVLRGYAEVPAKYREQIAAMVGSHTAVGGG